MDIFNLSYATDDCKYAPGLSHSNSKVVSSLTLGRQLGPGVVSGMGKVTCVPIGCLFTYIY